MSNKTITRPCPFCTEPVKRIRTEPMKFPRHGEDFVQDVNFYKCSCQPKEFWLIASIDNNVSRETSKTEKNSL